MGYADATKNSVRIEKGKNGYTRYFPKCKNCGEECSQMNYVSGYEYLCKECKEKEALKSKEITLEVKEKKFENAISRINKMLKNKYSNTKKETIEDYSKAIKLAHEAMIDHNWYDSTEEIMTAIELIHNGFKIINHHKVDKYVVDFILPDQHIILEIDGMAYHNITTSVREKERDRNILKIMGSKYEILRVTDKCINSNILCLTQGLFLGYNGIKKLREKRIYRNNNNIDGYLE